MPNYANGKIYTIRCRSNDTLIYIGSTTQKLTQRLAKHRSSCKRGVGCSIYKYIVNDDWSEWYIELYEMYPCNSKEELEKREGEVIREIGTINKFIAGRTNKEWREDNIDKLKEYKKKHYENNVEKLKKFYEDNAEKISEKRKEKVCCDICGAFMRKDGLTRHQKTKNCTDIASKK